MWLDANYFVSLQPLSYVNHCRFVMRRELVLLLLLVMLVPLSAQSTREYYQSYIDRYSRLAQEHQAQYHIPACITLAQGLLESAAGRSELAVKANNHFGIKCAGDWTGATYHYDDDAKDECFRKYKKAEDSFRDHALFLQRTRYQSLFTLSIDDYKGWAHGLKQCGYATDPAYAGKLIKLIEDYELMQYVVAQTDKEKASSQVNGRKPASQQETKPKTQKNATGKVKPTKTSGKKQTVDIAEPVDSIETKTVSVLPKDDRRGMEAVNLCAEHTVMRNNGKRYVVANLGDTFKSIAQEFNMYETTLRRYNDIVNPRYELQEGDKVYLQRKRRKAERIYAVYRVRKGENIWQIAQDKGMRLKSIYRLNGIEEGQNVTINQELKLR